MPPTQYDPGLVSMSFGAILITGIAKGTFVSAERNKDAWSIDVGAGGDVTRTKNRDRSGMVTVTLQQSSPSNDALSARARLDELSSAGASPLIVKDLSGTTLVQAEAAWVKKLPKTEFGDESSNREWIFECADLEIVAGGNDAIIAT
jgi:hypothetical protein